ncbi:hypothetical protein HYW21_01225 [Candidatus Woesearchaeota archaeon]|nr:hypothetical protein [Candidatus Woesearchaeota archaeon]
MKTTLYQLLIDADALNQRLARRMLHDKMYARHVGALPRDSELSLFKIQIDPREVQKGLMRGYETNPVFRDAIEGRKSIETSLDELAQPNTGIKKFLPRRRNRTYNARIEQLGELITEPSHLRSYGIWMPDNAVTTTLGTMVLALGIGYMLTPNTLPGIDADFSLPAMVAYLKTNKAMITGGAVVTSLVGVVVTMKRFNSLPSAEAKYIDAKIQEVYGK